VFNIIHIVLHPGLDGRVPPQPVHLRPACDSRPDLVLYLDMYPDVSRELLSVRYRRDERKKDIHEANFAYLQRCRGCALYAAERFGWRVIPCSDERRPFGIEEIAERVYEAAAACIRRP